MYIHPQPCSGCLEGVLDVLPIAGAYCLDELYHRCLRWVAKHFVVVLPTRNYAALPPEVQDRCLKQLLDDMVSVLPSSDKLVMLYIFFHVQVCSASKPFF